MTEPRPTSTSPTARLSPWWCGAAVVAAAFVAYHNSFHGPFVFDDASSIVTNPTIQKLWPLTGPLSPPSANVTAQGRPILNLSLAINYAIGETAVESYHVVNLLIHALAGLALFGITRRLLAAISTGATGLALAVAVLWTIHPLQTESVTYVIQRAESLVGLFYLITVYCFIRSVAVDRRGPSAESRGQPGSIPISAPSPARRAAFLWSMLAVLSCLAGMATKEVMVTAPLMIWFLDRTFFAGSFVGALRRRWGLYAALGGTWILLAWLVAQTGGNRGGSVGFGVNVGWADYWLTQFRAIGRYLCLSFWPEPLVFEYGSFWIRGFDEIALQVGVVFGLLGATVFALWRRSWLGFAGAWFFGLLAPTSLAPGTTQMIVEHRMYLPLAAIIVVAVVAAQRIFSGRGAALKAGVLAGAAIALVLLTIRRNADYRSEIALWTDTVAKRPDNPLAHFMLAGAQERGGDVGAALASYEKTLDLKADFSIGHEIYGELLLRQGRRAEAIARFESALRLQPQYPDAHANLGNAYLAEGRITEAVGHLEKAVQLIPDSATTRYNYANALAAAGLSADAVDEYQAALRLQPAMAEAHFNLANVLTELRRPAEAMAHYESAIKARPGYAAAHYNLANALAASGRQRDAVEHYEAALRARPDYAEAHHNLGSTLFELGRLEEASRHYAEALRLQPNFPNARANLERVQARMKAKE